MKILGHVILVILASVGLLAIGILLLGYLENPGSAFRTYEELKASGLIERGWASPYLPRSTTDIKEWHDLDSNYGGASFKYKPGDVAVARDSCQLLHETKDGAKYLCPPYEKQTSILILKTDGNGEFSARPDEI